MPTSQLTQNVKDAHILIVDDEPANVKLLERMLNVEGYNNITTTQDPRNVTHLYQEQESDLILLDINMPHMNGFEVMEELQKIKTTLPPILVLTAQSANEFRLKALESGARDYLTKPFDRTELMARVRNLLEVQLLHKYLSDQNELLEYVVKKRTQELHETRLQVVRRLGRAAEYRDNETGLHIIRMSKYSELMARGVGMTEYECDLVLNASPMHDIGKIGIPDYILLKPGKFEPHEWEIMKTHAEIGADILSGDETELLTMAREIAYTHHEKWDGSGYPRGLSGNNIPLVGRIVAIADVFDALTSERPYKKAWPVEDAINYIKEQKGKHFDPVLVDYFLSILPAVLEIKEKYAEPEG
jgi:putative two-component system response regulator